MTERSLPEIVADVSEKAAQLVREEIELAKAEITTKLTRLGKGAVIGAAAGIFVVFSLIYFFFGLAAFFTEELGFKAWAGFGLVTLILLLLAGVAGLVAYRLFKRGAPPVPNLAIEEAKLTRDAIEEVRADGG